MPNTTTTETARAGQNRAKHTPGPWEHNATKAFVDYKGEHHNGLASAVWSKKGETPMMKRIRKARAAIAKATQP